VSIGVSGCSQSSRFVFSTDSVECQRLHRFFRNLEETATGVKPETIAFFGHDPNEPLEELSFEQFKLVTSWVFGCCCAEPHPLANEWIGYNRLDCIRHNLDTEHVQGIAIYGFEGVPLDEMGRKPEDWGEPWARITEPKRIKQVIRVLCRAMDDEKDRFANELSPTMPMQIITDRHKFIIPVIQYDNAIRGIGWTSPELKQKLDEWGFHR